MVDIQSATAENRRGRPL